MPDSRHLSQNEHSYQEAIDVLTAALAPLDAPDKGLGYSWGLRRGQAGYYEEKCGRDNLRRLRDELVKHHEREEA